MPYVLIFLYKKMFYKTSCRQLGVDVTPWHSSMSTEENLLSIPILFNLLAKQVYWRMFEAFEAWSVYPCPPVPNKRGEREEGGGGGGRAGKLK